MSDTNIPEDTVKVGGTVAKIPDECAVCETDFEFGGWHMMHGQTHCGHCGSTYQIRPLSSETWDDVPYHSVKEAYIEPIRDFHEQTGKSIRTDATDFDAYLAEHYPDLGN